MSGMSTLVSSTITVAVSRLGADDDLLAAFDVVLDASDILAAWSVG
jgi:hypothetical protein